MSGGRVEEKQSIANLCGVYETSAVRRKSVSTVPEKQVLCFERNSVVNICFSLG